MRFMPASCAAAGPSAAPCLAAAAGAAMVRVHDAAGSRQALNAFDSVFYGG